MVESDVIKLQREVAFRRFLQNSIYDFSAAIHTSLDPDPIVRIFFSTLMAPMGISKAFLCHRTRQVFRRRGLVISANEKKYLARQLSSVLKNVLRLDVDEIGPENDELRRMLQSKGITTLLNLADRPGRVVALGLGAKRNGQPITDEDIEYVEFLSRFLLMALDNSHYLSQMVEKKKLELELSIASDIQRALMPTEVPGLQRYEIATHYEPILEVGGDYYDLLPRRRNMQPIVLADVEGKGLAAALLAASSQAIFRSLNELYFFEPGRFVAKANSLICQFTHGRRFITLFWMLLDDDTPRITYVNAGHVAPYLIRQNGVRRLEQGGMLTGYIPEVEYQEESVELASGDLIAIFSDGVNEVENPAGEQFGDDALLDSLRRDRRLPCAEILDRLHRRIKTHAEGRRFRDDFSIILIKVR